MYTQKELEKAREIIKMIAREHNVTEDQVRADMQEAMDCGRQNTDPVVTAQWEKFRYAGAEPTVEEFILWVSSKVSFDGN